MGLRVIGAGLPRTGTLSLKFALEKLGFSHCYHMAELIAHEEHAALWLAAAQGLPDWDVLFEHYQATTDFPGCVFWRELQEAYPDAPVVLSVRDPDRWFESVSSTVGQKEHFAELAASPIGPLMMSLAQRMPFSDDRAFMTRLFRQHVDEVRSTVPADRLLIFEAHQGWDPLCASLGVPPPEGPYPRVNSRAEAAALVASDGKATPFAELQRRSRELIRASRSPVESTA